MRQAFETWYSGNDPGKRSIERDEIRYKMLQAESAWQTWQAAWNTRAALQQQGEAVSDGHVCDAECDAAIDRTFNSLESQGEAVAWIHKNGHELLLDEKMHRATNPANWNPLYTHPPKPVVSDAMVERAISAAMTIKHNKEAWFPMTDRRMKRALEAALGVKS